MKAGVETFIGLFLLTIMVLICSNLVSADINAMTAKTVHAKYAEEIENSYFSDSVIGKCKADAAKKGYALEVEKSYLGGVQVTYIDLIYTYNVPIFNLSNDYVVHRVAR